VARQLQAGTALPPKKENSIIIQQEAGRIPEPGCRRENYCAAADNGIAIIW